MTGHTVVGWFSIGFFLIAILILLFFGVLLLFPLLQALFIVNPQILIIASDVLALFAAVLGFLSRRTGPGKIGGIGGLVLFVLLTLLLSFTLITGVQTQVSG
jgi:hypothetical protein